MSKSVFQSLRVWNRQTRNWKIISIRSLFSRFFEKLTLNFQSIYITLLGADSLQLGFLNSISNISGGLISVPIGWLQDKFSLKKILLSGMALSLLVTALFGLASTWIMIIPAMLFYTVALNVGWCLTICDVSVKNADRSTCKGVCDGFFQVPSLFAPILAAFVISYFGGMSAQGIRPLYWIQFTGNLILLLILYISLTEIERPPITQSQGFLEDYQKVFQNGIGLKRWILFFLINTFILSMLTPFTPLYAFEVKGADQYILGGMMTASLVTLVILSPFFGTLADKIGRKMVAFLLEPFYLASLLLLVSAPSPLFLIVSSLLNGFNMIVGFVCLTPLQVELVPIEYRGRWRGILGLVSGLVSIPAPIIGGLIWNLMGPSVLILSPILIDLLIRMPLLFTIPERKPYT
ncbi:MAG: MFS transporter [Candidatus Heimdallarchaeota archaeon]